MFSVSSVANLFAGNSIVNLLPFPPRFRRDLAVMSIDYLPDEAKTEAVAVYLCVDNLLANDRTVRIFVFDRS